MSEQIYPYNLSFNSDNSDKTMSKIQTIKKGKKMQACFKIYSIIGWWVNLFRLGFFYNFLRCIRVTVKFLLFVLILACYFHNQKRPNPPTLHLKKINQSEKNKKGFSGVLGCMMHHGGSLNLQFYGHENASIWSLKDSSILNA